MSESEIGAMIAKYFGIDLRGFQQPRNSRISRWICGSKFSGAIDPCTKMSA